MSASVDYAALIDDAAASHWFRAALQLALQRDPVDAANDARRLSDILEARVERIQREWIRK